MFAKGFERRPVCRLGRIYLPDLRTMESSYMHLHGLAPPDSRPGEGPAAWTPELAWGPVAGQELLRATAWQWAGPQRLPAVKPGAWQSMGAK